MVTGRDWRGDLSTMRRKSVIYEDGAMYWNAVH